MSELILKVLRQAGRAIHNPFAMNNGYVLPRNGDARIDAIKLSGDMRVVGRDLKKTATQALQRHAK
ncbi:hypothetical protein [Limnohabitans sp. DM1]|uniref:hypothetical protein n=1 Tax=Limnohabitans sp. DM1 TaxID=1597955 RepID=UPI000AAB5A16|nr:hypothetical protein [Limnohabitans sp. DM1]